MALLLQLKANLLPPELRSLETTVVLEQIEQSLNSHMPSLDAAARAPGASAASRAPGASAASIVAALLWEVASIRRSSGGSVGSSRRDFDDEEGGDTVSAPTLLSDYVLEATISRSVSFRRVVTAVTAIDLLESQDGSRLVLTHGL